MRGFMKTRIINFFLAASITCWSVTGFAENLMEVFQQALNYDPTFKAAEAQFLAVNELIPITRGALLPQITTGGTLARLHEDIDFITRQKFYDTSTQYNITANQAIFNYRAWAQLQNAKAQSKQAFASYSAASQDLMVRVANAYFSVLQAYDELMATEANKRSLEQQLHQTEEQFKVGLIAITGVDQVRASYDLAVAQEIVNQNTVADKLEELRAITGIFYTCLAGIKVNFPLVSPQPENINDWVLVAAQQNYTLLSAYYAMIAAQQNVKVQRAGHFPTITGSASYAYDNETANQLGIGSGTSSGALVPETTRIATIGVNASLPIFTGGTVTAETNQAAWQYAQVSAQREQTYRNVTTQTRESFLGVLSGINKIKADRQSIHSNESSLSATKASYTVGTATIVDVLQQQSNLYSAQTQYAVDQYAYILSTLTLKEAAGTLSVKDMRLVNQWLGKNLDFSKFNFNVHPIQYASDTLPKISPTSNSYNPTEPIDPGAPQDYSEGAPQQRPPAAIPNTGVPANTSSTSNAKVSMAPTAHSSKSGAANKKLSSKHKTKNHAKLTHAPLKKKLSTG